ncbi:hypothetical protein ANN_12614 [Periplaneta americana]|uniref:Uncharacterized protein n=1 Tax=Periplaneta americana TaxID=6978 RepID=A0ABQ8TI26_PERAM|nr:hypothetical protein ANN_12614 [Periplaneta americana]
MDLKEVGYDYRDWINLAQDRDRWRAYPCNEHDGTKTEYRSLRISQMGKLSLRFLLAFFIIMWSFIQVSVDATISNSVSSGWRIRGAQRVYATTAYCKNGDSSVTAQPLFLQRNGPVPSVHATKTYDNQKEENEEGNEEKKRRSRDELEAKEEEYNEEDKMLSKFTGTFTVLVL